MKKSQLKQLIKECMTEGVYIQPSKMEKYYSDGMSEKELLDKLSELPGFDKEMERESNFKQEIRNFIYNKESSARGIESLQNAITTLQSILKSIISQEKKIGLKSMPAFYRILDSIDTFEKTLKK